MSLPLPSQEAQEASFQLQQIIRQAIQASPNAWIPFDQYMNLALYTPKLGYYSGGSHKLGAKGDFTTAPEMTALFGQTLANQIQTLLPQTAGNLYEFGAGSGKLAIDICQALTEQGCHFQHYYIFDLSAELIERQQQAIQAALPEHFHRFIWLTSLPTKFDGVIIGNEVLDAMPCQRVHYCGKCYWEEGVSLAKDNSTLTLCKQKRHSETVLSLAQTYLPPIPNYSSEIHLNQTAFIQTLADKLERGGMIFIDYGFPAHEYYHPERYMGTLIGHYRHHSIHDPLFWPGLMDLTCHVNFTGIAEAGIDAGLDLIGYTTQTAFLLNNGILDKLAQYNPNNIAQYLPIANPVQKLLSPTEMGELFKVIAFGKGIDIDWKGFKTGDRSHLL